MIDGIRVLDAHMHVLGRFKKRDETFIEFLNRFNIDKAIITSLNMTTSMAKIHKITETSKEAFNTEFDMSSQLDHTEVLNLTQKYPNRLIGFYWFNPKNATEDHWKELERYINQHGFKGIKTQACVNLLRMPNDLFSLAEFCIDHDIPIYLHSGVGFFFQKAYRAKDIHKLVQKYPELKVIIGHAGYTMEYAINLLNYFVKTPNVYFETSLSVPYAIIMFIKAFGSERIMYGSDSPTAGTPKIEQDKIRILNLDKEALENVFYNTAVKLIGQKQ